MNVEEHPFTVDEVVAAAERDAKKFFYIVAPSEKALAAEAKKLGLTPERGFLTSDKKCVFALWRKDATWTDPVVKSEPKKLWRRKKKDA